MPKQCKAAGLTPVDPPKGPRPSQASRYGYLGGKQRSTELASGAIAMGARSYLPTIGRFLQVDPVNGGSANPYDYVGQDPLDASDLTGNCIWGNAICQLAARVNTPNAPAGQSTLANPIKQASHASGGPNPYGNSGKPTPGGTCKKRRGCGEPMPKPMKHCLEWGSAGAAGGAIAGGLLGAAGGAVAGCVGAVNQDVFG
jgi:RHS repeat-associated protein